MIKKKTQKENLKSNQHQFLKFNKFSPYNSKKETLNFKI